MTDSHHSSRNGRTHCPVVEHLRDGDTVLCCPVTACPSNGIGTPMYDRCSDARYPLMVVLVGDKSHCCAMSSCRHHSPPGLPINAVALWCAVCGAHFCLDCAIQLQEVLLLGAAHPS